MQPQTPNYRYIRSEAFWTTHKKQIEESRDSLIKCSAGPIGVLYLSDLAILRRIDSSSLSATILSATPPATTAGQNRTKSVFLDAYLASPVSRADDNRPSVASVQKFLGIDVTRFIVRNSGVIVLPAHWKLNLYDVEDLLYRNYASVPTIPNFEVGDVYAAFLLNALAINDNSRWEIVPTAEPDYSNVPVRLENDTDFDEPVTKEFRRDHAFYVPFRKPVFSLWSLEETALMNDANARLGDLTRHNGLSRLPHDIRERSERRLDWNEPQRIADERKPVLLVSRLPESRRWISSSLWKAIQFVLEVGDKNLGIQVAMVSIKDRNDASKRYDMIRVSYAPGLENSKKGTALIGFFSPQYNEYSGTIEVSESSIVIYPFLTFDEATQLQDMYISNEGSNAKDGGVSISNPRFYASLIQELLILSGSSYRLATGPYPELENQPGYAVIAVDGELRTPVSFVNLYAQAPVTIARGDAPPEADTKPLKIATEVQQSDRNSSGVKKAIRQKPNRTLYI